MASIVSDRIGTSKPGGRFGIRYIQEFHARFQVLFRTAMTRYWYLNIGLRCVGPLTKSCSRVPCGSWRPGPRARACICPRCSVQTNGNPRSLSGRVSTNKSIMAIETIHGWIRWPHSVPTCLSSTASFSPLARSRSLSRH